MKEINYEKYSDEELFERYKRHNDQDAFKALYGKYSSKIMAYCIRACYDRETARDVFQKIFTNIILKKDTFKGGSYIAWIMIITRNFCLMEKRNMKYTDELNENLMVNNDLENDDFMMKDELKKIINELPDEYREVIKLRYYDDFSYNEIAEILEITVALVKIRLFRAKKIILKEIEPIKEKIQ